MAFDCGFIELIVNCLVLFIVDDAVKDASLLDVLLLRLLMPFE